MRNFKRSTQSILMCIIGSLLVLSILRLAVEFYLHGNTLTSASVTILVIVSFLVILFIILDNALLPDFEYSIRVHKDIIIFEMDDEDHRRINRLFTIVSRERKYLFLSDGISRIRIAYNKEVLEFLNEILN